MGQRIGRPALRVATLEECARYGNALPKGLLPPIAGAGTPTAGAWPGIVGASGYLLVNWSAATTGGTSAAGTNDVSALPSGCTVAYTGPTGYQFAAPPQTTAKYLENAAGTSKSGGCVFNNGNFTVKFTWSAGHSFAGTISVYQCDYDSSSRSQKVSDGTTQFTIASGSAFEGGAWLQWTESIASGGSITFTFTANGGPSQTLVSGFFFDASGGASAHSLVAPSRYQRNALLRR